MISDLAIAEMLNFPKLYGPGYFDGAFAQPEALVVALEQLETAVVDPAQLTGSETVDSVEAQTIDDLQMLGRISLDFLRNVTLPGLGSDIGRQQALVDSSEYPTISSAIETDAELFTPAAPATPVTVINPPPPPITGIAQYLVTNITTGVADWDYGAAYSGPLAQLTNDFITTTSDNINVTATSPNNFIRTGSGDDAIDVSLLGQVPGGMNVLDGGGGSNFLVGGRESTDTFFFDDSGPMSSDVWSTITNFHAGDSATIWGVTPDDFVLTWMDGQGAAGYTGLTLHSVQNEYVDSSADNLTITADVPDNYIYSGSGESAIDVSSAGGVNVLDGGTGSAFMTGGAGVGYGTDTFFLDDRGLSTDIWSTIANFHSGDAATVWGVTSSDFDLSWVDRQGATGYTGLALHVTGAGVPTASLTLSGLTSADLTNGALTVSFGTRAATGGMPDNNYMYIHAN